jgi:glycosyltransferase involved in cell wall biosynthesis
MKFSIIIPAYNVENYLPDCLLSIQKQSFRDFEVLIVDDGSVDGSGRIAKEFEEHDSRFKVIQKENGGVSSARNRGLEHATGEYVWFIDGDDYIHPESLAYLTAIYFMHPDADYVTFHCAVVSTPYADCKELANSLRFDENKCFDCNTMQGFVSAVAASPREACLTCYKRSVLTNERYGPFRLGEDTLFSKQIVYKSQRVVSTQESLYYYYFRGESASHVTLFPHIMDYLKVCRELHKFKGKRHGWADKALARFCFEVGLVDGMTRLMALPSSREKKAAFRAWLSNADSFLEVFSEASVPKARLHLACRTRSFWLSWIFFHIRYLPRRFIARYPRVGSALRTFRALPAINERETDTDLQVL